MSEILSFSIEITTLSNQVKMSDEIGRICDYPVKMSNFDHSHKVYLF